MVMIVIRIKVEKSSWNKFEISQGGTLPDGKKESEKSIETTTFFELLSVAWIYIILDITGGL